MEDKYAAQTDFLSAESVSSFYRQILQYGSIGESLTQEIAEDQYPEPEASRALDIAPDVKREADIEPER